MLPFGYERFQDNYFGPHDIEPPLSSASLSAPSVDWATFGLHHDNLAFAAENSQAPSYASFDYNNLSHPGLTTSSSGDISEVEDYSRYPLTNPPIHDSADISSVGDPLEPEPFRHSPESSFMGVPQASLLASNNLESLDIDDYLKNAEAQTSALEQINTRMSMDSSKTFPDRRSLDQDTSLRSSSVSDVTTDERSRPLPPAQSYSNPLWGPASYNNILSASPGTTDDQLQHNVWVS